MTPADRHPLHRPDRIWPAKNCYVDLWIGVLHHLGLQPLAAGSAALSCDFEGDQWAFVKMPAEDLRLLYGIEVAEINVWRPVLDHVLEQQARGRLTTVEVDAYHLPDTEGINYGEAHGKTTIVPHQVDPVRRQLSYFHNDGHFTADDDDFDGIFGLAAHRLPAGWSPYLEVIGLDRVIHRSEPELAAQADGLLTVHLARRADGDPVRRLAARIEADLPWLADQGPSVFPAYAFATCRQFGAGAELAGATALWLADTGRPAAPVLRTAAASLLRAAETAKSLQFMLARAARGRAVTVQPLLASMADDWAAALSVLGERAA